MNSEHEVKDPTLHLPRILCLHGGGTNARIFRAQCRAIVGQLKSEYRLVFAQGPFDSQAGPDVLSVYGKWGPFRRWLRWRPEDPMIRPEDAVNKVNQCLRECMRQDDMLGATGEWFALLGFSQGAKLAASLLYRQQVHDELSGKHRGSTKFRFGILIAGRGPLVSLDSDLVLNPPLPDASQITDYRNSSGGMSTEKNSHVLRIPTLHVHGLEDEGIELHRHLFRDFCDESTRTLVEWDGNHRVPLKFKEVSWIVNQIRELDKATSLAEVTA
ncbi:hypothetical protein BP6252_11344 [Coleophoma cylindrospora]|uniref:Serine hydrolase domain-containing protein n=1 Tax=Coleophoma cylindrospora TaxID=1849047 RepID=A0A3D8QPR7_9HELO|nr:hypothetical protein BP6252_11344 [Coleophoma cylindrospora]